MRNKPHEMEHLVGQRLKRDLFSPSGMLVLPAHTVLREEHLHKLAVRNSGLTTNDVHETKELEASRIVEEAIEQIRQIFRETHHLRRIPLIEVRKRVIPAIHQAAENGSIFSLLNELQAKDDYTYRHNIAVGVIASMIGKWLKLSEANLTSLTIAATLHDIGKIKVPLHILNKPGIYTEEEFEVMKEHTLYGYELLMNTVGISHRQALVALQHHERMDGSGYPHGLKGDEIELFSRIVAVADVFHAMTSDRAYHEAVPFYKVLGEMHRNAFGKLDPTITTLLINKIMNSLVGNQTMLSDGRQGKIVMVNPHNFANPVVFTGDEFLDLSKMDDVNMERVIG